MEFSIATTVTPAGLQCLSISISIWIVRPFRKAARHGLLPQEKSMYCGITVSIPHRCIEAFKIFFVSISSFIFTAGLFIVMAQLSPGWDQPHFVLVHESLGVSSAGLPPPLHCLSQGFSLAAHCSHCSKLKDFWLRQLAYSWMQSQQWASRMHLAYWC